MFFFSNFKASPNILRFTYCLPVRGSIAVLQPGKSKLGSIILLLVLRKYFPQLRSSLYIWYEITVGGVRARGVLMLGAVLMLVASILSDCAEFACCWLETIFSFSYLVSTVFQGNSSAKSKFNRKRPPKNRNRGITVQGLDANCDQKVSLARKFSNRQ